MEEEIEEREREIERVQGRCEARRRGGGDGEEVGED